MAATSINNQIRNKKGMALGQIVVLIAGLILMLGVLWGLLFYTGLINNFSNFIMVFICQISSIFRGIMVIILWAFISVILAMLILSTAMTSAQNSGALSKVLGMSSGGWAARLVGGAVVGTIASKGLVGLLAIAAISMLFTGIPIMCSPLIIHHGSLKNPIDNQTEVATFIGAKAVDCWNMYGAGHFDPLWGIDPPNPRICFISNTYVNQTMNMSAIYYEIMNQNPNWVLGPTQGVDPNVFLFCPTSKGSDPNNWGECKIQNNTVYILYRDKHEYDEQSYDSGVCGGRIKKDNIGDKDSIVICIDNIVIPASQSADSPAMCGDGKQDQAVEDCNNCPSDFPCPFGQECRLSSGVYACANCKDTMESCTQTADCCSGDRCCPYSQLCITEGFTCPCSNYQESCSVDADCCGTASLKCCLGKCIDSSAVCPLECSRVNQHVCIYGASGEGNEVPYPSGAYETDISRYGADCINVNNNLVIDRTSKQDCWNTYPEDVSNPSGDCMCNTKESGPTNALVYTAKCLYSRSFTCKMPDGTIW